MRFGHEVAVHHVDVQQVGLGADAVDLGAEAAKSAERIDGAIFDRELGRRPPVLATRSEGAQDEDVHAVGAGGAGEEQGAAAVRTPRGAGRRRSA